jgi:hypothetical protein
MCLDCSVSDTFHTYLVFHNKKINSIVALQDTSAVQVMPQESEAESDISLRPPPAPRSSVMSGASLLTPVVIFEETEEQLLERSSVEERASSIVDQASIASATPRTGGLGGYSPTPRTPATAHHRCISEIVLEDAVGLTQALVNAEGERTQLFSDQSEDLNTDVNTESDSFSVSSFTPGGSSGGERTPLFTGVFTRVGLGCSGASHDVSTCSPTSIT